MTRENEKTFTFWLIVCFQIIVILVMVGLKQSVILYGKTIVLKTQPVDPHSLFQGDYARLSFAINSVEIQGSEKWQIGDKIYTELASSGTSWNFVAVHRNLPEPLPDNHAILKGIVQFQTQQSGYPVSELKDFSNPGWLDTQPDTANWRQGWGPFGRQQGIWYDRYEENLEGTTVFVVLYSDDNKLWDFGQILESTDAAHSPYPHTRILTGKLGFYKEQKILNVGYGIESYFIPEGKGRKYEQPGLDVEIAVNNKGHAVVKKVILP